MPRNFVGINNELIADGHLLRLDIHTAPGYLEEGKPCFTEVTKDDVEEPNEDAKEEPRIFDLEEEAKKKSTLHKEKRDV